MLRVLYGYLDEANVLFIRLSLHAPWYGLLCRPSWIPKVLKQPVGRFVLGHHVTYFWGPGCFDLEP